MRLIFHGQQHLLVSVTKNNLENFLTTTSAVNRLSCRLRQWVVVDLQVGGFIETFIQVYSLHKFWYFFLSLGHLPLWGLPIHSFPPFRLPLLPLAGPTLWQKASLRANSVYRSRSMKNISPTISPWTASMHQDCPLLDVIQSHSSNRFPIRLNVT